MGNDGGSIPDRRDLVRNKPKAEQADKANQTRARWFFCALSKRKLQEPVVSCALGKLYNKDAIIEYLLDKSAYGDGEKICGHIRSLKDVKTLKLIPNPSPRATAEPASEHPQFICPLTMKEMNGIQPFVYIFPCGCTISKAALKALSSAHSPPSSSSSSSSSPKNNTDADADKSVEAKEAKEKQLSLCPQCAVKYSPSEDVFTLNPTPEEEEVMSLSLDRKRALESEKRGKKRKNKESAEGEQPPTKKLDTQPSLNPTVAATSHVLKSKLAMEEARRKAEMSEAVKSIYDRKDGGKRKETFLTMNTFTRYA